jgi:hypothetical protein
LLSIGSYRELTTMILGYMWSKTYLIGFLISIMALRDLYNRKEEWIVHYAGFKQYELALAIISSFQDKYYICKYSIICWITDYLVFIVFLFITAKLVWSTAYLLHNKQIQIIYYGEEEKIEETDFELEDII